MTTILDKIVQNKQSELAEMKRCVPLDELRRRVESAPPVRDFVEALQATAERSGIALIAEVKKASPSAGRIREDCDPVAIARTYQRHGAACISCLTDERFFRGRLEDLQEGVERVAYF